MPPYTLKSMAEAGYVMGLATIGEVATHMHLHYSAYFLIDELPAQLKEFDDMVASHEDSSIFKWLTAEDMSRMDDELEKAFAESPGKPPTEIDPMP